MTVSFATPAPSSPSPEALVGGTDLNIACGPSDLTKVRAISRGAHSLVWLVMLRGEGGGGRYFALKTYSKERITKVGEAKHVLREKTALRALQPHPFVVSLYATFQDSKTVYFLLSLGLGGDLRGLLVRHQRRQQPMVEATAAFHAGVLTMVLGHLHARGFAYRDLKPENVLIDSHGYALLCDFGTAVHLGDKGRALTVVGTWEYAAPEQLEERGSTMASDWWALGVLLLECLTNATPFPSGNEDDPMVVMRAIHNFGRAARIDGSGGDATSGSHAGGTGHGTHAHGSVSGGAGGGSAGHSGSGSSNDGCGDCGGSSSCITDGAEDPRLAPLSGAARRLVCALLQPDEQQRWGAASAEQLRGYSFFESLDWAALYERRLAAPFVPAILGEADTRNFLHCNLAEGALDREIGVPLDAGDCSSRSGSHDSDLNECEHRSKRRKECTDDFWDTF